MQTKHIPSLGGFNTIVLRELSGLARLLHIHIKLTDVLVTGGHDPRLGLQSPQALDIKDYDPMPDLAIEKGNSKDCGEIDPQNLLRRLFGELSAISYYSQVKALPDDVDVDEVMATRARDWKEQHGGDYEDILGEEYLNATRKDFHVHYEKRNVPGDTLASNFDDIIDAGDVDGLLIDKILTWSTDPRSREYLNAKDGNQAAEYYEAAYTKPKAPQLVAEVA